MVAEGKAVVEGDGAAAALTAIAVRQFNGRPNGRGALSS
jgi:hypothetical protein